MKHGIKALILVQKKIRRLVENVHYDKNVHMDLNYFVFALKWYFSFTSIFPQTSWSAYTRCLTWALSSWVHPLLASSLSLQALPKLLCYLDSMHTTAPLWLSVVQDYQLGKERWGAETSRERIFFFSSKGNLSSRFKVVIHSSWFFFYLFLLEM